MFSFLSTVIITGLFYNLSLRCPPYESSIFDYLQRVRPAKTNRTVRKHRLIRDFAGYKFTKILFPCAAQFVFDVLHYLNAHMRTWFVRV